MSVSIDPNHVATKRRNQPSPSPCRAAPKGTYQRLLSALIMPSESPSALQVVGITSVNSGEGVSSVSRGLAEAAASRGGGASLLIDLSCKSDFHDSSKMRRDVSDDSDTVADAGASLIDAISGRVEVASVITQSSCPGLMLSSAGNQPIDMLNADEVHQLGKLLADLRQQFELVVVDLPSVTDSSAATLLGRLFDGMLLVVEAEKVPSESAKRVLQELRQSGGNMIGAVLNKQREYLPKWLRRRIRHGDGRAHLENRSER